ncbi:hypothetical protein D4Z93_03560 [Clostridium fermenticellae]|uniref:Uncharacterized protein n=1 Tax=Clostridium fermenticellae TaxID=2068654 RepID=A0A386H269_9CLOT|nr:hypothetical protein [Clostridium fermenticellae]AYD39645.1 hypothetical protein D4Z93_03560 [Clostridium fermenticellae]
MNILFLCLIVLSITGILSLTILAVFCYKQDNIKMLFESKTTMSENGVSSNAKVDINKCKKENSK